MLILERELLTMRRSFNPSPSTSAARSCPIKLSIGYVSGPVKPKLVLLVSASLDRPKLAPPRRQQTNMRGRIVSLLTLAALRACGSGSAPASFLGRAKFNVLFRLPKCFISRGGNCQPPARLTSLFPDKVDEHPAVMWLPAMFPKVKFLPGAEHQPAFLHRYAQIDGRERRANVRRHIVITFAGVLEQRVTIGRETREKPLQITPDFRIGIFLNQERSRGVLEMEGGQPGLETCLGSQRLHLVGELVKAPATRAHLDLMDTLPQHHQPGYGFDAPPSSSGGQMARSSGVLKLSWYQRSSFSRSARGRRDQAARSSPMDLASDS